MVTFLSEEWAELCRELFAGLPARPGVSARVAHVITGTPHGVVVVGLVVEDGRVLSVATGRAAEADSGADLTITTTLADARRLAAGDLDASVAVMQGRAKVAGDVGKLLALLPLTRTPQYRSALAALHERTTSES
ncbi:MAG TPA: SCP2 sterol-binding domain-containing protein [Acidimicrobiales bacterium]|nr:SCP2 sterol-binding domain-containing protein [Acidimicrobiales bacterium]